MSSMQSWTQSAYASFWEAVPLPWSQAATHSVVAFAAAASGDGTWGQKVSSCFSVSPFTGQAGGTGTLLPPPPEWVSHRTIRSQPNGWMGRLTEMHFAWQSTSPEAQAFRQAASEAWAASVVVTEATEETVEGVLDDVWALASTAKAPATRKLVKRILDVCKL